jgi:hypothetical protein
MESRTTGAISLGGTGNIQGTYKFLSLRSGEIVVRRAWTKLPVPRDVIERVEELAINEPEYNDEGDKNEEEIDELDNALVNRMGFIQNQYDPCVYNKATEDGLVTICTHVDDLKVSSKTKEQIQKVIKQLVNIYKAITVHQGKFMITLE